MNDYACILIWDAHTRMGHNIGPYAYGISHTRMGRPIRVWANIRIWGRTFLNIYNCAYKTLFANPVTNIASYAVYSRKVWRVESLANLANRLRFAKLKPSKLVVTINNPLADLFIRKLFSPNT